MFIWLNVLLTMMFLPVALLFGKIKRVGLCKDAVNDQVNEAFPVSKWTPYLDLEPRGWFRCWMERNGIGGMACLGYVFIQQRHELIVFHECVHVMQQSAVSPALIGLTYLLDIIVFLPWRGWFKEGEAKRVSTVEVVAYRVTGQDEWSSGQD
jgi:hypothetical protein